MLYTLRNVLVAASVVALAGCGGSNIASPGSGTLASGENDSDTVIITSTGAAADCPAGFTDAGIINNFRNCTLPGTIRADLTVPYRAGTLYSLSGRVDVGVDAGSDGAAPAGVRATLSIEPGVVLFGSSGLDFLVVQRGSRLNAVGTATQPIIFTGRRNVEGAATDDSQALWGGIILLGRAPISDCIANVPGGSVNCTQLFEGGADMPFGGATADDDSGRLEYVQIRYAGFEIAPDRELNGLTLAGVGSGTVIDHVQVHNSSDDGVEWFGGRVNARHLVLTGNDDDAIDTDIGYQGFIQDLLVVQRASGQSGDAMIEADSNGNEDALPRQWTRIANFTFIHRNSSASNAMLIRGGADYALVNGIVISPSFCLDIDGQATVRAANPALQDQGPPLFQSVLFSCQSGAYREDGNVSLAEVEAIFEQPGSNNAPDFTSTLVDIFIDGPAELQTPVYDASILGDFFEARDYVGAVRDASATWYRGWTCDSATANFRSGQSCRSLPLI